MIPIDSLTLRFGLGCFETIKVYPNDQIAFLDEHLDRLLVGIQVLGLPSCPSLRSEDGSHLKDITKAGLKKQVIDFVNQNKSNKTQILRLIYTKETGLQCFIQDYEEKTNSLNLTISKDWRIDSISPLNKFKSFNYLKNHLAFQDAQKLGFDDVILLNEKEEIAEASRANVFFKTKTGSWITPNVESGCLPGVVREKLIEFLKAEEKMIPLSDLSDFENCFVCNSLIEVQQVSKIADVDFESFDVSELKDYLRRLSV